jgi:hypothetical protein
MNKYLWLSRSGRALYPTPLKLYTTTTVAGAECLVRPRRRPPPMSDPKLYKIVIPPAISEYAGSATDIEAYLKKKFAGESINFRVTVAPHIMLHMQT